MEPPTDIKVEGFYDGTYDVLNDFIGGGLIGSSQGFFVRLSTVGSSSLQFDNSMRRTGDPSFLKSTPKYDYILKIETEQNGFGDITYIPFGDGPTQGWDSKYDGLKMESDFGRSTLFTKIGSERVAINSRPRLDQVVQSIPLGIIPSSNGQFILRFEEMTSLPSTAMVYLEDLKTGIWADLRTSTQLSFMADIQDDPNRFVIHFYPPAELVSSDAGCDDVDGSVYIDLGNHLVNGQPLPWSSFEVRSALGLLVESGNISSTSWVVEDLLPGNYELRLYINGYVLEEEFEVEALQTVDAQFDLDRSSFDVGEEVEFDDRSLGSGDYLWDFGDGSQMTVQGDVLHTYSLPGVYYPSLTITSDDCDDFFEEKISVLSKTTGIEEADWDLDLTYVSGTLIIEVDEVDPDATGLIIDAVGKQVTSWKGLETYQEIPLNVASGIYFLHIVKGEQTRQYNLFVPED